MEYYRICQHQSMSVNVSKHLAAFVHQEAGEPTKNTLLDDNYLGKIYC